MPSPIGHALAGAAVALTWERLRDAAVRRPALSTMVVACVVLAVLPDADLLYLRGHRTATHSFTAVALVTIIAAGVTRWVTGRIDWSVAAACGFAAFTHLAIDWLGEDFNNPRGIQAMWPFSDRWFFSGWDVFRFTERRNVFSMRTIWTNTLTGLQEIALLAPIVLLLWWTRKPRRSDQA